VISSGRSEPPLEYGCSNCPKPLFSFKTCLEPENEWSRCLIENVGNKVRVDRRRIESLLSVRGDFLFVLRFWLGDED
jgi:hypothetical protein